MKMKNHFVALFLASLCLWLVGCSGTGPSSSSSSSSTLNSSSSKEVALAEYRLTVGNEIVENPTAQQITDSLRALDNGDDSFLILELKEPIDEVLYIQSALPRAGYEDDLGYIFEIGVTVDRDGFRLYEYRTTDIEELCGLFLNYFEKGLLPEGYTQWPDPLV